jgi:ATP-binding cassette subfamily G (WHITE) protein 2
MITDADRQGKGGDLATVYEKSDIKANNDAQLERLMSEKASDLPPEVLKELQVTKATVTPWWWAFKTLVKYR